MALASVAHSPVVCRLGSPLVLHYLPRSPTTSPPPSADRVGIGIRALLVDNGGLIETFRIVFKIIRCWDFHRQLRNLYCKGSGFNGDAICAACFTLCFIWYAKVAEKFQSAPARAQPIPRYPYTIGRRRQSAPGTTDRTG